jgi:hypothetical protein
VGVINKDKAKTAAGKTPFLSIASGKLALFRDNLDTKRFIWN